MQVTISLLPSPDLGGTLAAAVTEGPNLPETGPARGSGPSQTQVEAGRRVAREWLRGAGLGGTGG